MGYKDFLTKLPNGSMYQHPALQLLKDVLCEKTTNAVVLGFFGAILLRKSLLGRRDSDHSDKVSTGKAVWRCASCGIAEGNENRLNHCNGCDLVRYCSDECLQDHWPQHAARCKKRAVELRDEILFRQPESTHMGDCPICCLPLPLDPTKRLLMGCCSKILCVGCDYANHVREIEEKLDQKCPFFCRHITPKTSEEGEKYAMRRAEQNDPTALWQMGVRYFNREEYDLAFEYYTRAVELGDADADAHYHLSLLYSLGQGVAKDEKKELYHLEEAAIQGHPNARYNLGCVEWENSKFERAAKHFIIAANLGHDESMKALKRCYKFGDVSKNDFAAALRGHYAAVAATKSPQREFGEKMHQSTKT